MKQLLIGLVVLAGFIYWRFTPPSAHAAVGTITINQSVSGSVTAGDVTSSKFIDSASASYFLDPAATGNALVVAGNVGIGTTAPGAALELNGNFLFTKALARTLSIDRSTAGSAGAALTISGGSATSGGTDLTGGDVTINTGISTGNGNGGSAIYFQTSRSVISGTADRALSTVMTIKSNVGIGTTTPAYKLDVVGSAGLSTGTLWTNTSDARIKQNIETIPDALAVISQLNPAQFMYTQSYLDGHPEISNTKHYGFIAQEFQRVFPESVSMGDDGLLRVNASNVIPYAVKAIKEQQQEIDQLKADNEALKHKVSDYDELKARLNRLEIMVNAQTGR